MTITCAIIDDEPLAAGLLKSYVEKTPFLQLIGTFGSAIEAMRELRSNPVQLLFLDIQMPELSGIEFAKILTPSTKIIFTTAFQQYAIEGYKVNALDYLMKPISYDEFLTSANKALDWYTIAQKQELYARDRFMFVKSDYKLIRVSLDDILYIEGLKDYVRFYLQDGTRIMSLMNMKKIEDYLPHPEFLRTHRSFIVHMPLAQQVDRFRIVFGDQFIPVSDSYKDEVLQYLDAHTLV
ncbi:LytTR family DNA-binding domain-containing protein [Prevotella sp. tf2-5]|jgi:DNA-binding LytR/AlgR family response regulator|uniref:LytR/AlgR family response regulator transcription factor n=1 Tax=Prevotella sp. tf2-5 TaxID=1761889 RepID=UPI0008E8851A|nr:LytTR family DNA-binding domain-containing protein [Prevotella sp. tf2-5]MCR5711328.1 LytTR family DNA-binding domain-containing protein [Prevotella sp.]SFO91849.1 two component transcriptional regulator, LytTR family [Prevotella sp. tf2-5]